MTALILFPSRIRFVNNDGTLTPEAYRAFQEIVNRTGGVLGDSGADVFGSVVADASQSAQNIAYTDIQQPISQEQTLSDVVQPVSVNQSFPDIVQPQTNDLTGPITAKNGVTTITSQTGTGTKFVVDTSPTLITPKATTTLGVGNATPSASGSGISFPATQSDSTDANTLDDYEEGTWTPSVLGSTINGAATYTTQVGRYTKIGNRVTAVCNMVWTAHTGTGNTLVSGLPFNTVNVTGLDQSAFCMANNLTITGLPVFTVTPNQAVGTVYALNSGAIASLALDTAATLAFTFNYIAA